MKFTIIMPTYNDAESIVETLETVISQRYKNWELLISDDGSTDNTKEIVKDFIESHNEKRIKYFYEKNADQLNAITHVLNEITGDYVYILHSDDKFYDDDVLSKAKNYLKNNKVDAIISSPVIIDEKSVENGILKVKKYKKDDSNIALQLLWLGRNLFIDFAFHDKNSFITNVKNNYLEWNTPFWLDLTNEPRMLNVNSVDFPFFKYRVFEGNYINNPIGKLNVINGELRTAVSIMKYYYIPFYKTQYIIYRIFNKLNISYKPFYKKCESKNKEKVVKFILQKRYKNEYNENLFLKNLYKYYKNYTNKSISIDKINEKDFIYYGKDVRKFNNDLINNELSHIYLDVINKLPLGFNEVLVKDKNDLEKMQIVLKFLCIAPFVKIRIKK